MPESPVGSDQPESTSGRHTSDSTAAEHIAAAIAQLQSELSSRLQESSRQLFEATAKAIAAAASQQAVENLLTAAARIDRETTQASILRALLAETSNFSERVLFLLVRPDETRGWAARGYPGSASMKGAEIDRRGSCWERLLEGAGTVVLSADECADFDRQLDVSASKTGALIPFVLRGQLAAALYVSGETEPDHGSLRLLAHLAALTLETTAGSAAASPALRLAESGAPSPGIEIWQAAVSAPATRAEPEPTDDRDDPQQAVSEEPSGADEEPIEEAPVPEEQPEAEPEPPASVHESKDDRPTEELPAMELAPIEEVTEEVAEVAAEVADIGGEPIEEATDDRESEEVLEEKKSEEDLSVADEVPMLEVEEYDTTDELPLPRVAELDAADEAGELDQASEESESAPIAHPASFESAWTAEKEEEEKEKKRQEEGEEKEAEAADDVVTAAFSTADVPEPEELPEIEDSDVVDTDGEVDEDTAPEELALEEAGDEAEAMIFDTTEAIPTATEGATTDLDEATDDADSDQAADLWTLEEDVAEPELEPDDTIDEEVEDEAVEDEDEDDTYVGDAPQVESGIPAGQETVRLDVAHLQEQALPQPEEERTTELSAFDESAEPAFEEPEFELEPEELEPDELEDVRDAASVAADEDGSSDLSEAPTIMTSVAELGLPQEEPTAPEPSPTPETFEPPAVAPEPVEQPPTAGSGSEVLPPQDLSGPGSAFVSTQPAEQTDPDQALHEEAKRLARLLVSEIKLYNEEIIEQGRREGNIYDRLKDDIDRSRQMYSERIDPRLANAEDYFQQELVQRLANGDADLLGM